MECGDFVGLSSRIALRFIRATLARLLDMMSQTLTRLDDRALFDLDGKAEEAKQEPEPEQIIQPKAKIASFTPRPDTDEI